MMATMTPIHIAGCAPMRKASGGWLKPDRIDARLLALSNCRAFSTRRLVLGLEKDHKRFSAPLCEVLIDHITDRAKIIETKTTPAPTVKKGVKRRHPVLWRAAGILVAPRFR